MPFPVPSTTWIAHLQQAVLHVLDGLRLLLEQALLVPLLSIQLLLDIPKQQVLMLMLLVLLLMGSLLRPRMQTFTSQQTTPLLQAVSCVAAG